ncbi:MAG: hypothetical protein H6726_29765 [Sandaracinaceae bacterium]|nr:hypothetical protein [Sandaracinaceae bacterium]
MRVLYWDRDGYVLVTKRLEVGRYRLEAMRRIPTPRSRWSRGAAPCCWRASTCRRRRGDVVGRRRRLVAEKAQRILGAGDFVRRALFLKLDDDSSAARRQRPLAGPREGPSSWWRAVAAGTVEADGGRRDPPPRPHARRQPRGSSAATWRGDAQATIETSRRLQQELLFSIAPAANENSTAEADEGEAKQSGERATGRQTAPRTRPRRTAQQPRLPSC